MSVHTKRLLVAGTLQVTKLPRKWHSRGVYNIVHVVLVTSGLHSILVAWSATIELASVVTAVESLLTWMAVESMAHAQLGVCGELAVVRRGRARAPSVQR